jgi:hypothetical protein
MRELSAAFSGPCRAFDMPLVIALVMADGQIFCVAIATFAQGLHVFQRGIHRVHMLATHPARHLAVQLAGHGFVDFVAGMAEFAHGAK